jgi:uncharacterized membrane protein YgaE (UPF0421/DUF939 family)
MEETTASAPPSVPAPTAYLPSEAFESEVAILNAQILQLEEQLEIAYQKLEAQDMQATRRERELTAAAKFAHPHTTLFSSFWRAALSRTAIQLFDTHAKQCSSPALLCAVPRST